MIIDLPKSDVLDTELSGGWLTLTMNDPGRRNALSSEMASALLSLCAAIREDRSMRGVTLRGSDGVFCSGGDLKGMARQIMAADRSAIEEMSRRGGELFASFASLPQVTICLIDGPAMAGGLGLACCADLVAVTEGASFALTEVRLGIPPAQIAPYVVKRLGLPAAKRLMLTGAKFGGGEAARLGLADHLAKDQAGLEDYAEGVRRQVLGCAPGAIAATKALALRAADVPPQELTGEAARAFADSLLSEEGKEGIMSFVQKRKPNWARHD